MIRTSYQDFSLSEVLTTDSVTVDIKDFNRLECNRELAQTINTDYFQLKYYDNWYSANLEYFYLKRLSSILALFNELIGEHLSEYMGLSTIHYRLVVNEEKLIGLFSKNFREPNVRYMLSEDLTTKAKYHISKVMHSRLRYRHHPLKQEMAAFIARNIYCCLFDREANSLVQVRDGNVSLAPLYDYESSFDYAKGNGYDDPIFSGGILSFDEYNSLLKQDVFKEAYDKVMAYDIEESLDSICDKHRILLPESVSNRYKEFDKSRKDYLQKQLKR